LKGVGAVLVHCLACHKGTYHVYPSSGIFQPGLDRRHFSTLSEPPPAPPQAAPAPQSQSAASGDENRGPRRVKLTLPLRVRSLEFGFTDVTTTVNVSRGGVYFLTENPYRNGQRVKVHLNYSSGGADTLEQLAEVVRVQHTPGSFQKGVALKYL
jgi:hypothetical protein